MFKVKLADDLRDIKGAFLMAVFLYWSDSGGSGENFTEFLLSPNNK